MNKQEWRKTYAASYLHSLHSPTSAFWVNGRLKWAKHAACKQKTNAYKIWIGKLHKPVGGTCHTWKDNIKINLNYLVSTTLKGSPVVDYNKVVNLLSSITTWDVWHSWVVFWRRSCTLPLVYMMSHDLSAPSCFCTLQLWWLESMWDDDSHNKT